MRISKRQHLACILLSGLLSAAGLALMTTDWSSYLAAPGLFMSTLLSVLIAGNPHGGFRSSVTDHSVTFICNMVFYYLLLLGCLKLTQVFAKKSRSTTAS